MKIQFFKVNWNAVNKAIPDNLKELRQAQRELEKKIQKKVNDYYRKQKEIETAGKIAGLKSMPVNSDVYFIGRNDKSVKFGCKGNKVEDKRIRMLVKFNNVIWSCHYTTLINRPPTDQEIRDRKLQTHFNKILNKIIL